MSHTPGPWEQWDKSPTFVEQAGTGVPIASMTLPGNYGGPQHYQEAQQTLIANARLIAASPELLSSLQEIFELIDNGMLVRNTSGDTNPNWAIRQLPLINALYKAKQAIAKAEGK